MGTLHEEHYTFLSYTAQLFLEWEIFQAKVLEKIKTKTLSSITLFRKSRRLWDNVKKYYRPGQAIDVMTEPHCVRNNCLQTHTHTHTQRLCNAYCFSTATIVAWRSLDVTLYVHCLSGFFWWGGVYLTILNYSEKYSRIQIMYKLKNVWKQTNACD